MNKQTEALKMAIEALEIVIVAYDQDEQFTKAIQACKEALKMAIGWAVEVYNDETCAKDLREGADEVINACKEALEQEIKNDINTSNT